MSIHAETPPGKGFPGGVCARHLLLVLAMMVACVMPVLTLGVVAAPIIAVVGAVKIMEVAVIEVAAACRIRAAITEAWIVAAVHVTIERRSLMPAACAHKSAAVEPLGAIVAVGCATVRSVTVITIRADRLGADADAERHLRAYRRNGADKEKCKSCDQNVLESAHWRDTSARVRGHAQGNSCAKAKISARNNLGLCLELVALCETFSESFLPRRHRLLQLRSFGQRLLAFDLLARRGPVERLHLALRQFAKRPRRHIQHQRTVADAADLLDMMADLFKHLAELPVAAFGQRHFIPGVFAATNLLDLCRLRQHAIAPSRANLVQPSAIDHDPSPQLVDRFRCGRTRNFDEIRLRYARRRLRQLIRKVAVVGHQQQTFAQVVQPPHRIQPRHLAVLADGFFLGILPQQLHHGRPLLGIVERGDIAAWLVHHKILLLLAALQQLAVDTDVVAAEVCFRAQLGDDLAIHLHAAIEDDLLRGTARSNARLREYLLQAIALRRLRRSGFSHTFYYLPSIAPARANRKIVSP